jgi:predicted DNA-binding transcriptional regulator AlpA
METKHDLNTLDVNDLARILKIKPRSLHARLVRRPESLPRPIQRGNGRKLLWLERDVVAWMMNEGDQK